MEQQAVDAMSLSGSVMQDLSIWGLFIQADIVVKIVMVLLLAASFWTWAIIFDKVVRLRRLRGMADDFEDDFWSGGSLDNLYDRMDKRRWARCRRQGELADLGPARLPGHHPRGCFR